MDPSAVALLGILCATLLGIWNAYQNLKITKQGKAISINVDGNLKETQDEGKALRLEVDALKKLVGAQDNDRVGEVGEAVLDATNAATAAAEVTSAAANTPRESKSPV